MNRRTKGILANLIFSIIIFIVILFSKKIVKAMAFSGVFFIFSTCLLIKFKSYSKMLAYLLAFLLPMTTILYSDKKSTDILYPGSEVGIIIKLYDIMIIMFMTYAIAMEVGSKKEEKIKMGKSIILPLAYLVIHILASKFSIDKQASICEIIRLCNMIILSIAITKIFDLEVYESFVKGIEHVVLFELFLGIAQIIKGGSVGLSFLGETGGFRGGVEGLEKGMSGTLQHPGTLAIFSVFCLCILLSSNELKSRKKYIIACVFIIILTFARTSIALMLVVLFGYFVINIYKGNISFRLTYKKVILGTFLILVIGCTVFLAKDELNVVVDRFTNSDFSEQAGNRNEHVKVALYVYKNGNQWAYGPNNYTVTIKNKFPAQYRAKNFYYRYPVHNLYALYLVELGVLGLSIYILLYLGNIFRMLKVINKEKRRSINIITLIAIWTLCMLFYNFTGWSGDKDTLITIMWIAIGISNSMFKRMDFEKTSEIFRG